MGTHKVAGAGFLTIQIHASPSVETSSTVHFGSQGIPAPHGQLRQRDAFP
jgi:hypothetical protein